MVTRRLHTANALTHTAAVSTRTADVTRVPLLETNDRAKSALNTKCAISQLACHFAISVSVYLF